MDRMKKIWNRKKARAAVCLLAAASLLAMGICPARAGAADRKDADWPGAYNHAYGNAVVDARLATNTDEIYEKWSVFVGSESDLAGYYAGQAVIADGCLYITGQGKIHKIDVETGETMRQADGGSTSVYYDYLAYGEGKVFVACPSYIQAFDADTLELLWRTSTGGQHSYLVGGQVNSARDYGLYRPIVYHNGYLFCGRNAFRTSSFETDSRGYNKPVWSIEDEFNRNAGVVVGDYYYVAAARKLYAVKYATGEVADSWEFSTSRSQATWSGVVYSPETKRLYWGSYIGSCIYSVPVREDGSLDHESAVIQYSQRTAGTPVVYNGRVYLAGENGSIDVLDAASLERIYTNRNSSSGSVQSTPVLTTAYENEDPSRPGHVYLYYQGYNSPGTTYVMEDWKGNTSARTIRKAAVPSREGYSTEQLAADGEGNLYSYNESGYLFAFKSSGVWLESLEVEEAVKPLDFDPKKVSYDCLVQGGSSGIHINFTPSPGGVVTVNGRACTDNTATVPRTATEVILEVASENPADTRTRVYRVSLSEPSEDAHLAELVLKKNGSSVMGLTPGFAENRYSYESSYTKDTDRVLLTLRLRDAHGAATAAGKGLADNSPPLNNQGGGVYSAYLSMDSRVDTAQVTVTVTAEDGITQLSYTVQFTRPDETAPVLSKGSAVRISDGRAEVTFSSTEVGRLYVRTEAAGVRVTSLDTGGDGRGIAAGKNVITVDSMSVRDTFIYLQAKDDAGNVSNLLQVPVDVMKMREPTVTGASGVANRKIRVAWEAIAGAAGYRIYRRQSGGSYALVGTAASGSSTSYTDTTAQPGVTYTYTVQAYREVGGTRYYSDYGQSYRSGVTWYPEKVSLQTASASGYSSVTIRWKRQTGATGFYVYRSTGGGYSRIAAVDGGDKNTYTDPLAPCGTKCTYMVRAYRKNGSAVYTGSYSGKKSATPKLKKPVLTVKLSSYRANLRWGKVSGATGYEVYMKKGKGSFKRISNVKNVKLKRNKTYRFRVRAYRVVKGKKVYSAYSATRKVKP